MARMSEESFKIYAAFQGYVKRGDKRKISQFSKDELEFAYNQVAVNQQDTAVQAMKRRLEKLEEEEMRNQQYEDILLEDEQKELLIALVEASRNVDRDKRQQFYLSQSMGGDSLLHPGLPNEDFKVYIGDLKALDKESLIDLDRVSYNAPVFDVTPLGYEYYRYLKSANSPIENVEEKVFQYIAAEQFRKDFPKAFAKWLKAEELLWSSDTKEQDTTIGHLCREAMQEFAEELVLKYKPGEYDHDKAKTKNRMKAVIGSFSDKLGEREIQFLEALNLYWDAINDLIQRQTHGGAKTGKELIWMDGRRCVFQLAVVMYEIESTFSMVSSSK